jgi:hypothetical protein
MRYHMYRGPSRHPVSLIPRNNLTSAVHQPGKHSRRLALQFDSDTSLMQFTIF